LNPKYAIDFLLRDENTLKSAILLCNSIKLFLQWLVQESLNYWNNALYRRVVYSIKIFRLILKPEFNALNFPIPGLLNHRYRRKRRGLPENEPCGREFSAGLIFPLIHQGVQGKFAKKKLSNSGKKKWGR